jgi:hypothetical protein
MEFTIVARSTKKAKPIAGILLLTILLNGCRVPIKQGSSLQACRDAEKVVQDAQQQSDKAIQDLSQAKDKDTSKITAANLQTLQEAEDKAFEKCYKIK